MSSMTQNGEQESHANGNPAEIVVDWDGPEDTENPLKCVCFPGIQLVADAQV